jgi:alpha-beta hydrolase superfamily lysophospholipase
MRSFSLTAPDGRALHVYHWEPAGPVRGVVQIAHGLAEHAGRYAELAGALAAAGYAVYAHDHRGHGQTALGADDRGFFAEKDGWRKCLDDLRQVNRQAAQAHPGVPLVLLGHSMGSFLAQQFMSENGNFLAGAILMATDGPPSLLARAGRGVARLERARLGARGRSALIHALAFGAFNRAFAPARTDFDWLSRDEAEVDRYGNDPSCGFVATVQLWIDLLDAWGSLARPARLAQIPRGLPILLLTGTRDPVSARGAGVKRLIRTYRRAGLECVSALFYEGARHELLHETNRAEVIRDLLGWLDFIIRA